MNTLSTHISPKEIRYDGTQLSCQWIYKTFDILDDAIVSFVGEADVGTSHMVDLEDVKKNAPIYSPSMLHFIGEWFHQDLYRAILHQHLFCNTIYELLTEKGIKALSKKGNDLFYQNKKLSVSIATASPLSVLMHTALNIETNGTPIPTSGLRELGIAPIDFANEVLNRFCEEYLEWERARRKVLPR